MAITCGVEKRYAPLAAPYASTGLRIAHYAMSVPDSAQQHALCQYGAAYAMPVPELHSRRCSTPSSIRYVSTGHRLACA
eukprot:860638-Rhodomonas_salina.2